MAFRVTWSADAEKELATIWTSSRFRHEVTESARELEAEMARDPLHLGESRAGEERIAFHGPLGCKFDVDVLRRHVVVIFVWKRK